MHKILEKMPLYTQFTQTLRDPCKILVHDIKNPFDYKCSIDAQVLPIEWAVLYRKSGYTQLHILSQFFEYGMSTLVQNGKFSAKTVFDDRMPMYMIPACH